MKHVFIINPVAGKVNRSEELTKKIKEIKTDHEVVIHITQSQGEAERLAREESDCEETVRIYACGGDGTANEVLTGIAGRDNASLGIVPIGSGNDFVKSLKDFETEDFLELEAMVNGDVHTVDLLECSGHYSMNIMTVGFDCAVANNMQRFKRLPLVSGSLAYKMSIIYCLFTKRKHRVHIWVDGERLKKADTKTTLLAICGNGNFYGGGIKACPQGVIDDGLIDFVHIETVSAVRFIALLGKYIKGQHVNNPKLPFVTSKRCTKVKFTANEPLDVNFDGEIVVLKDPEIRILPGALRIITPKKQ